MWTKLRKRKPISLEPVQAPPAEIKPDPPPNLSTKPPDKVGYCFGYVCPQKHIGDTFDEITVDGYKERRLCQECGEVSQPAILKWFSEYQWWAKYNGGRWMIDWEKSGKMVQLCATFPPTSFSTSFSTPFSTSCYEGSRPIRTQIKVMQFLDIPKEG